MKPTLSQVAAIVAVCGALCSCKLTKQRLDYNWFKDSVTSAQDDQVTVEAGSGLTTPPPTSGPEVVATPAAGQPRPGWWARNFGQQQKKAANWWKNSVVQGQQAPQPATPAAAPAVKAAPGGSYTVRSGDTLSAIATRHGVTMAALISTNSLTNPDALRVGQVLTIPGAAPAAPAAPAATSTPPLLPAPAVQTHYPAAANTAPQPAATGSGSYTVSSGDTLSAIARRHNISMQKLMQANGMTPAQAANLRIGQRIIIPR